MKKDIEMKQKKFYCHGEADEFPADEFYRDENGALIHKVGQKHYATTGEPVDPIVILEMAPPVCPKENHK